MQSIIILLSSGVYRILDFNNNNLGLMFCTCKFWCLKPLLVGRYRNTTTVNGLIIHFPVRLFDTLCSEVARVGRLSASRLVPSARVPDWWYQTIAKVCHQLVCVGWVDCLDHSVTMLRHVTNFFFIHPFLVLVIYVKLFFCRS